MIFATNVVDEEDKAIPIKNEFKSEKPKNKDKRKIKNIDKIICKKPAIIIIFFRANILLKSVSKPTANNKSKIPK
jgi:hypothetical protein